MEIGIDFWLELLVLLACLFYAAPRGGFTLGMIGGIGLIIFIFGFHMKPGKPPVDVILTILAVVCASATLQACGGLDCLLQIAEKLLRKHPRYDCCSDGRYLLAGGCGVRLHDWLHGKRPLPHRRSAL